MEHRFGTGLMVNGKNLKPSHGSCREPKSYDNGKYKRVIEREEENGG
jgi:hypothetical protein